MHGIVFAAFRDYVTATRGASAAQDLFSERPLYAMSEAYADEDFFAIIADAENAFATNASRLLVDFGIFTGENVFPRLYPAYYDVAGDARTFLLTVEDRIHELVRATIPHALPPRLRVRAASADSVEITYDSSRGLCRLLEGLAVGTSRHFGTTVEAVEVECVFRGSDACRFHIQFGPT